MGECRIKAMKQLVFSLFFSSIIVSRVAVGGARLNYENDDDERIISLLILQIADICEYHILFSSLFHSATTIAYYYYS